MAFSALDPLGFGAIGFRAHARRFSPLPTDLRGLRVAVTGATSGLGLATTQALTQLGATVWMLVRNVEKARALALPGDIKIVEVDIARKDSVAAVSLPELDVLVHNAGAMFDKREAVDGLEATVATHVVGPWRLSQRVKAGQTIWVSSGGMYTQRLNVARTFSPPEPFDGVTAYARCKRAQVVLAGRLGHHAMHPGWAATPGVHAALPRFEKFTQSILRTPEQGADTIVWLAATRPATPGFWFDRAPAAEWRLPFTRSSPGEEELLLARVAATA